MIRTHNTHMDREYLFTAAVVALGPPYLITGADRDMPKAPSRELFSDHVAAYNEFASENWGPQLWGVSYMNWSDWFYDLNNP